MAFTTYTAAVQPASRDLRDLVWATVQAGLSAPDFRNDDGTTITFGYLTDPQWSDAQVAAWQALMASNPQPVNAPWRVQQTLLDRAQTALTVNDTYLALTAPTTGQTLAQIKALTRECSALIRLLVQQLDTTAGT